MPERFEMYIHSISALYKYSPFLFLSDVTFFYFLFNDRLGDQLSQNILDRSSPYFQDMYTYGYA